MNPRPAGSAGGPEDGTWRLIAKRVAQLVATRLELLGFELAEERRAATELIVLLSVGAVFGALAVVILTVGLVLALPPEWRPWGALATGVGYGGVAGWAFLRVRRLLRGRSAPFAATVSELKRDKEWLEGLK
ncbi:MAG: phage holin family protein [Verrucomicrobiae bacterium]|nr:phage holin family protein [Verrucomicrobiae bacterium]